MPVNMEAPTIDTLSNQGLLKEKCELKIDEYGFLPCLHDAIYHSVDGAYFCDLDSLEITVKSTLMNVLVSHISMNIYSCDCMSSGVTGYMVRL